MRGENHFGIWVIADDASHNCSYSVAVGVDMHNVLAFFKHPSKPHWAVDIPDTLEWQNGDRYVHLLKLLNDGRDACEPPDR